MKILTSTGNASGGQVRSPDQLTSTYLSICGRINKFIFDLHCCIYDYRET